MSKYWIRFEGVLLLESIQHLLKLLMNKHEHPIGEELGIQEKCCMNFNPVDHPKDDWNIQTKNDYFLESGWIHDVAFSPLGDHLAWVSHNSIIFAVSAHNPSRFV